MGKKLTTTCISFPFNKLERLYKESTYKPTIDEIRLFRAATGIPMLRCKYCLAIANGDWELAKHVDMDGV